MVKHAFHRGHWGIRFAIEAVVALFEQARTQHNEDGSVTRFPADFRAQVEASLKAWKERVDKFKRRQTKPPPQS